MTGLKETSCRLCLKNISDKSFQVIDGVTRDILGILLLQLTFSGENKEVICNTCRRKLNEALEFKSMCLNTNYKIIPHVDCESMLQPDLAEIYMKEKRNCYLTGVSCNHKICVLCMQLIKNEIRYIGEEELAAIHKFLPEINISIIKNPISCKTCFESLTTHNTFLKNCLEVDKKISNNIKSSNKHSKTNVSLSNLFIKNEDVDEEFETNEGAMLIKNESVDIKSEDDEKVSDTLIVHSNKGVFESDCNDSEGECLKYMRKQITPLYKCVKCTYETANENRFIAHCAEHNVSKLHKCETCNYVTNQKELLKSHRLKHKDLSEVQTYICNDCGYKTKYKTNLASHVFLHKDPSQVQMYKCNYCDYETKFKNYLASHVLKHKGPSEVQMYECGACDYKTKYKSSLASHVLQHKGPSEVQMYKCDACDFECRYKSSLIVHTLRHKNISEVQMYRCNDCDFKTKYKNRIASHVLQHKDPSEVQTYNCDTCGYKSRHKRYLTNHQLIHKVPLKVQMYKCDACGYGSRYKSNLIKHQLIHRSFRSANVQM